MDNLDELRSSSQFVDEQDNGRSSRSSKPPKKSPKKPAPKSNKLTSAQIFIIAALLFVFVLIAGFFAMIFTGSMVL